MGPHGLKGMVKAKLGLDDVQMVKEAGPLLTEDGRQWVVKQVAMAGKGLWALKLEGVDTVEGAEALRGTAVFLDRGAWPEDEDEVYLADYIGKDAHDLHGAAVGVVKGIVELPAGPALDIGGKLVPVNEVFVLLGDEVVLTDLGLDLLAV